MEEKLNKAVKAVEAWLDTLTTQASLYDKKTAKYDAYLAVKDAVDVKNNYFYRCTNRREEYNDLKNGVKIISKNHADGYEEKGMSVCETLSYTMQGYKYVYKVKGEVIGSGSDGEPILVNATPVGRLMLAESAAKQDKDREFRNATIKKIAEHTNLRHDQIQALLLAGDSILAAYSTPEATGLA